MPAVYDKWERLVTATLRREQLRETAMIRTPSNLSSASSQSFNLRADFGRVSSVSLLVGDSFPFSQILVATNFFHDSRIIKHGHSGDLYAGVLESGIEVAVKKVNVSSTEVGLNLQSEMDICGMLNHSRILPLMGHCLDYAADDNSRLLSIWADSEDRFLIYKYMPNGDLSRFLSDRQPLNWTTRFRIAVGVAEGLCYLHHQCFRPIVHRDIQATSILLDDEFEVRLGSLMGVCFEEKDIDPNNSIARFLRLPKGLEQNKSGVSNATCAYDVYCFGKVLLELITGKLGPRAFSDTRVKSWLANILCYIVSSDKTIVAKIIDSSLVMDEHLLEEVWTVSLLAKACLNPKPSKRPKMSEILKAFEHLKLAKLIAVELNLGSSTTLLNNGSLITSLKYHPKGKILEHSRNLRIFTALELKHATRDFAMDTWIGQDEFGRVYRGLLDDDLVPVIAIKRMNLKEIQLLESEVDLLGRLSHPNILSPFGYSWNSGELLLVYEFMEWSLQKYLFEYSALEILPWEKRLKVLIGAARGLAFLHASERQGLFPHKQEGGGFYGYLKSSKILIDSDYNAKITGFTMAEVGPSKFVRNQFDDGMLNFRSRVEECYAAPEFNVFGGRSLLESDVYGFGVLLVAMLIGGETYKHLSDIAEIDQFRGISEEIDLIFEISKLEPLQFITKKIDQSFQRIFGSRAVVLMVKLALSCVRQEYKLRPSMHQVMRDLEGIEKMHQGFHIS